MGMSVAVQKRFGTVLVGFLAPRHCATDTTLPPSSEAFQNTHVLLGCGSACRLAPPGCAGWDLAGPVGFGAAFRAEPRLLRGRRVPGAHRGASLTHCEKKPRQVAWTRSDPLPVTAATTLLSRASKPGQVRHPCVCVCGGNPVLVGRPCKAKGANVYSYYAEAGEGRSGVCEGGGAPPGGRAPQEGGRPQRAGLHTASCIQEDELCGRPSEAAGARWV